MSKLSKEDFQRLYDRAFTYLRSCGYSETEAKEILENRLTILCSDLAGKPIEVWEGALLYALPSGSLPSNIEGGKLFKREDCPFSAPLPDQIQTVPSHELRELREKIVARLCSKGMPQDKAEDTVQDIFSILLKHQEGILNFRGFAWGCIPRKLCEWWRHLAQHEKLQEKLKATFLVESKESPNPEKVPENYGIRKCFQSLSLQERKILWLRFVMEVSQNDCAKMLGISVHTAKKHEGSGKGKLRRCLGLSSHPAAENKAKKGNSS